MKQPFLVLTAIVLMLGVFSCQPSLQVTSDYDKSVNFQQYKTFSMYKMEQLDDAISPLNKDRIYNSIRKEMNNKGYTENDSNPDLLVNAVAILKDKVSVSSNTNYYGYGGVYRPYGWGVRPGYSVTDYNVQHYKDGSLIIDVIDAGTKKLIWHGSGNREIDKPLENPDTEIPEAVQSIMANFPPSTNKKS